MEIQCKIKVLPTPLIRISHIQYSVFNVILKNYQMQTSLILSSILLSNNIFSSLSVMKFINKCNVFTLSNCSNLCNKSIIQPPLKLCSFYFFKEQKFKYKFCYKHKKFEDMYAKNTNTYLSFVAQKFAKYISSNIIFQEKDLNVNIFILSFTRS